jgi:polyisoprenoid-binding protein YceI
LKIVAVLIVSLFVAFSGFVVSSLESDAARAVNSPLPSTAIRYEIDKTTSKFMVKASRGGLAWFKGHSHYIAVRDYGGEATLDLAAINPATLALTIQADSLEETDPWFTQQQKDIIKRELDELVLESAKYPTITFTSTEVKGKLEGGKFEVKITGDITLHGVTKRIVIPATVTANADTLNAKGEFTLDRSDFNVKATSAFHGMVRVKNKLKFTFDINARRV